MSKCIWELDFKTFSEKVRAIRAPQYCEDYYRLGKRHQTGCHYYLYVDGDLNIINPYTKKDEGKKVYKSFVSTTSREDVMKQAYDFIIAYAKKKAYLIFNYLQDMKELRLKFKGVDDWNRPVFVDDNGRFFGDTGHLFDYGASKDDVLDFYKDMPLNSCICYFGQHFGCEPIGTTIKPEVKVILV